ncbi:MAG: GntR family transcriptional regulator [Bacilli bacterium]|nr:GntR family transcriptional regulator [Bacilli bacterium]MBN2877217.1 GntR family transcriptional regulator [Bacilli bacterium]
MKNIQVSTTSKKPIYQQLFEQISSNIIRGDLKTDSLLPSIRTAAKELRISVITVKKAWEELEQKGFIYTIPGKGCFIAKLTEHEKEKKKEEQILSRLKTHLSYYKSLGLQKEDLIDYIKKYY